MKKYIAILAGNHKQFREFVNQAEKNPLIEYVYIDRPEKLFGFRFSGYQIVGTFWETSNSVELEDLVKERLF